MSTLLIASNNQGKIKEIKAVLGDFYNEIVSLKDKEIDLETVEDGDTFEANAYKKAKEGMEASGMDTLADDSGLCVDALDGAPGIFSARFAGEDANDTANNIKLAKLMQGVTREDRTARFVCTVCLMRTDGSYTAARGEVEGVIAETPAGENGFGYDPYFFVPQYHKTMAQLPPEIKNTISHRANALNALRQKLKDNE